MALESILWAYSTTLTGRFVMLGMAIAWFIVLFVVGWFFFRPGGWLSDEKKSPKSGRHDT